MYTISVHNSDVYGIAFQSSRPFIFASCSRDTTVRHFCIEGLVQQLKMKLICGSTKVPQEVLDDPQQTNKLKGQYKLCSKKAYELINKANNEGFKDEFSKQIAIFDYLYHQDG